MSKDLDGERRITPKWTEVAAPLMFPHLFNRLPAQRISERQIAIFCRGCDNLQPDNTCKYNDLNDQARYAARLDCGMACINGKPGIMTADGFSQNFPDRH